MDITQLLDKGRNFTDLFEHKNPAANIESHDTHNLILNVMCKKIRFDSSEKNYRGVQVQTVFLSNYYTLEFRIFN